MWNPQAWKKLPFHRLLPQQHNTPPRLSCHSPATEAWLEQRQLASTALLSSQLHCRRHEGWIRLNWSLVNPYSLFPVTVSSFMCPDVGSRRSPSLVSPQADDQLSSSSSQVSECRGLADTGGEDLPYPCLLSLHRLHLQGPWQEDYCTPRREWSTHQVTWVQPGLCCAGLHTRLGLQAALCYTNSLVAGQTPFKTGAWWQLPPITSNYSTRTTIPSSRTAAINSCKNIVSACRQKIQTYLSYCLGKKSYNR